MSYRYAIGRKSIASVSHAADIAQHIDWISEGRRDFTARDIIREVNDKINWWKNIHIQSYMNDENDVFSVLFPWFVENPQEDPIKYFMEHEWYIDLANCTVDVKERENPPQRTSHDLYIEPDIFTEYSDYKDWVNLAKFIKGPTHTATVEYNGVIEWYGCNVWGGGPIQIEKHYSDAKEFPGWWIAPEYITKLVPINN